MAALSERSLRRSSRRGEVPETALVTQNQAKLNKPTKRARIPSFSEPGNLSKKAKIDRETTLRFKVPLRSRRYPLSSVPVQNGIETVLADDKRTLADDGAQESPRGTPTSIALEKRTLRSQDGGSRSKSELSQYFHNYEKMISLELPIPEPLNSNTIITLLDDSRGNADSTPGTDPFAAHRPLHQAQRIDLATLATSPSRRFARDSLPEEIYQKAHRKAERHEKQLRNIEKERAQHEKFQLDRLLGELKGPDWLKVLGVSGVTDTEKKLYEPKRTLFVREVTALICKFRHWKEEEKRRKLEREQLLSGELEDRQAIHESDAAADGDDEDEDEEINSEDEDQVASVSPFSPDTSEMDAAAARQLHQEAIGASDFPSTIRYRESHLPASTSPFSPPRRPPVKRIYKARSSPRSAKIPTDHPPGSISPHGRRRRGLIQAMTRGSGANSTTGEHIQTRQMSRRRVSRN